MAAASKSPIGITTIVTVLGVVLGGIFSFAFSQIQNTKDTTATHTTQLAVQQVKIQDLESKYNTLVQQTELLRTAVEDGNSAILKAIKEKR